MLGLFIRLEDGALERLFQVRNQIPGITPEDLVTTLASKTNLDVAGRAPSHHVLREQSWARTRLVHVVYELGEQVDEFVFRGDNLERLRPAGVRHLPRIRRLVEFRALAEGARETLSDARRCMRRLRAEMILESRPPLR